MVTRANKWFMSMYNIYTMYNMYNTPKEIELNISSAHAIYS